MIATTYLWPGGLHATATAVGAMAPTIFGAILQCQSRLALFAGYAVAAAVMCGAGLIAAMIGVPAEGQSLEQLAAISEPPNAVPAVSQNPSSNAS